MASQNQAHLFEQEYFLTSEMAKSRTIKCVVTSSRLPWAAQIEASEKTAVLCKVYLATNWSYVRLNTKLFATLK